MPVTRIRRRRVNACLTAVAGIAALLTPQAAQATAAPAAPGWRVDLTRLGSAETNIRHAGGLRVADVLAHPAGSATGAVRVTSRASVPTGAQLLVEVRGWKQGRGWTEWRQATGGTATLASAVSTVQARVTLRANVSGATPVLSALELTPVVATAQQNAAAAAAASPLTSRVYATREALVGSTTANGHTIRSRDHFVALPSRRGLSSNGSTQYSVRVCNPANGRCETAPVWDVGPWNTKDDYWNVSSTRESFRDLPRGRPEAQAAYQDGYNGGRDGSGRRVGNPAGIDLADGTFWDGLGMNDNGWVNVTYLWTIGGTTASWPNVTQGATGERVKTVQYLLNQAGASLSVDGDFGSGTLAAVKAFQSSHGLSPDGEVGPLTWPKLAITLRQGANGQAVKGLQSQLVAHGRSIAVDGDFGANTLAAVRAFQTDAGIGVDGVVGPQTWQELVG